MPAAGTIFPGQWQVTIACIFRSLREGFGERTVWLHYRYFNRALPKDQQDRVSWIAAEIFEPNQGGRIAQAIDAHFDAAPYQTLSLEDRVVAQAYVGSFGAITTALDVVSYLVLAVVMSIVGNTLAMNVRERTHEYGVMRAIGFGASHLRLLVLAEAVLLGLLGAAVGLGALITMHASVSQRSREIGILRALGFGQPTILFSFVVESAALGFGGALIGAAASLFTQLLEFRCLNFATGQEVAFRFAPSFTQLGLAILAGTAVGAIGGLMPAIRAARVSPVQAMR